MLAQQVGIKAMFSDWPATVTYYANCMNLKSGSLPRPRGASFRHRPRR